MADKRLGLLINFNVVLNKDATGRAKDRIDAEELRKQNPIT